MSSNDSTPHSNSKQYDNIDFGQLAQDIKDWGKSLGFQKIGISDIKLEEAETHLKQWLGNGFHGEMDYMAKHGSKRSHPEELEPGTIRIISGRIDYLPHEHEMINASLDDKAQ